MDCDERLSPDLAQEIAVAIATPGLNAFRYRRTNYFLHRPMRHGGWDSWNLGGLIAELQSESGGGSRQV